MDVLLPEVGELIFSNLPTSTSLGPTVDKGISCADTNMLRDRVDLCPEEYDAAFANSVRLATRHADMLNECFPVRLSTVVFGVADLHSEVVPDGSE